MFLKTFENCKIFIKTLQITLKTLLKDCNFSLLFAKIFETFSHPMTLYAAIPLISPHLVDFDPRKIPAGTSVYIKNSSSAQRKMQPKPVGIIFQEKAQSLAGLLSG